MLLSVNIIASMQWSKKNGTLRMCDKFIIDCVVRWKLMLCATYMTKALHSCQVDFKITTSNGDPIMPGSNYPVHSSLQRMIEINSSHYYNYVSWYTLHSCMLCRRYASSQDNWCKTCGFTDYSCMKQLWRTHALVMYVANKISRTRSQ